jgi:N-acetylglucosaminyl-diphospho-decaprenol L-rhamnosyltransferase
VDEVVVVDNPSTPEERERVTALEGARSVLPEENRGYGAALNAGAAAAGGDLLLLMNPDMEATPGSVALLAGALERYQAAAPNYHWDRAGRWFLPHPQPHTWRTELTSHARPEAALRQALAYQTRLWTGAEPAEVPLLSGAAFLVRREAFEAVGGFDERYFLYFEENDLFERFRAAGFRAAVVPYSRFLHFHAPGRADGQAARYRESKALYEAAWFPRPYLHGRKLLQAPVPPPAPALDWDAPLDAAGRTVLYSPSPFLLPCAAAFAPQGRPTPRELLAGTPARDGFLALAEGSAVRERFGLGVQ